MSDKNFIMDKCSGFSKQQNLQVLKLISDMKIKVHEGLDGSRVNLDTLTHKQLQQIKLYIKTIDKPLDEKYQIT